MAERERPAFLVEHLRHAALASVDASPTSGSPRSGNIERLRLESWSITPTCRQRGVDVAWDDAVARLRKVYDTQLARFDGEPITLTLSIERSHDDRR